MYVVTVIFLVKDSYVKEFTQAVLVQAENSLSREANCLLFDVCLNPDNPEKFFLYEAYTQESDFLDHLKTDHFLQFDKLVKDWLVSKKVETWEKQS